MCSKFVVGIDIAWALNFNKYYPVVIAEAKLLPKKREFLGYFFA